MSFSKFSRFASSILFNTSTKSNIFKVIKISNDKKSIFIIASSILIGTAFFAKTNNLFNTNLKLYAKEDNASNTEPVNEKVLVITPRQKLFFQFASVEYNGMPYMTPQDFLESVTENHPRRICFFIFFELKL